MTPFMTAISHRGDMECFKTSFYYSKLNYSLLKPDKFPQVFCPGLCWLLCFIPILISNSNLLKGLTCRYQVWIILIFFLRTIIKFNLITNEDSRGWRLCSLLDSFLIFLSLSWLHNIEFAQQGDFLLNAAWGLLSYIFCSWFPHELVLLYRSYSKLSLQLSIQTRKTSTTHFSLAVSSLCPKVSLIHSYMCQSNPDTWMSPC